MQWLMVSVERGAAGQHTGLVRGRGFESPRYPKPHRANRLGSIAKGEYDGFGEGAKDS